MTSRATLLWTAAVIVALTGGFMSGVWAGTKTAQDTIVDLIERADLTTDCQSQIDLAVRGAISDWEGGPPPCALTGEGGLAQFERQVTQILRLS